MLGRYSERYCIVQVAGGQIGNPIFPRGVDRLKFGSYIANNYQKCCSQGG
jgi:hypothetical protein